MIINASGSVQVFNQLSGLSPQPTPIRLQLNLFEQPLDPFLGRLHSDVTTARFA